MTCDFMSLSTVFWSNQVDRGMIIKRLIIMQWNKFTFERVFVERLVKSRLLDQ